MKIAVTSPSGHIGSLVADYLLAAGADVRLLARKPEKLSRLVNRGAGVAEGSLEDQKFVVEATRGVDALFWVTPPDLGASDFREFQSRVGRTAAEAIRVNRIPRVVNISSVGAHLRSGGGPINGLYDVEQLLDRVATHVMHLRAGYFFENFLVQLESIKWEGKIRLPVSGSRRIPMIATRDIARVAADKLVETTWTGRCVRGLHGPADLSFDEAAAAISQGLQREVVFVRVEGDVARQAMVAAGLSGQVADVMLEMYRSIDAGALRPQEQRSPETFTPTRLVDFARETIRPLIEEPAGKEA
jgi:uncharacterized protein YbjT (DUF2867 family)